MTGGAFVAGAVGSDIGCTFGCGALVVLPRSKGECEILVLSISLSSKGIGSPRPRLSSGEKLKLSKSSIQQFLRQKKISSGVLTPLFFRSLFSKPFYSEELLFTLFAFSDSTVNHY
jgi:hypothetical protein